MSFEAQSPPQFRLRFAHRRLLIILTRYTDQITPFTIELQFQWTGDRCFQRHHPVWQSSHMVKGLKQMKRLGYNLDHALLSMLHA